MSEKRFTIHKESKYKEEWYAYPFCIKEDGEVVFNNIPLSIAEKVRDKLNEQQATITHLEKVNGKNFAKRRLLEQDNLVLRNENEQLRKELKEIKENPINFFQGD